MIYIYTEKIKDLERKRKKKRETQTETEKDTEGGRVRKNAEKKFQIKFHCMQRN